MMIARMAKEQQQQQQIAFQSVNRYRMRMKERNEKLKRRRNKKEILIINSLDFFRFVCAMPCLRTDETQL